MGMADIEYEAINVIVKCTVKGAESGIRGKYITGTIVLLSEVDLILNEEHTHRKQRYDRLSADAEYHVGKDTVVSE